MFPGEGSRPASFRKSFEGAVIANLASGSDQPLHSSATRPQSSDKAVALSLLWGTQFSSYAIRYALGVAAPILMQQFNISAETMGYVLSGWNWAYTASMMFVGMLVDRLGAWVVMGVGSVLWSLSTIALPIAATAASLFAMRAVFGLAHSMLIPTTAASVSRIFGPQERARAIAVSYSGNQVGLALGSPIAAYILHLAGWQSVFYWMGSGSLLIAAAWIFLYPDRSKGSRAVRADAVSSATLRPLSWGSLFRYRATWALALGQAGYLYAFYFFVSWLPGYLVIERKMTILRTGLVGSLPFLAGLLGTLAGGWLADYLIRRGVDLTIARKSVIGAGLSASTGMVIAAAFTEQTWLAVMFLVLCMFCLRLATGSIHSLPIELAPPSLVASLAGISNFSANVSGIMAPILTGYIVTNTGSFVLALVVAGGMALLGAVSFVFILGPVRKY